MENIVVVAGKRTAFGSFGGGLSTVSGTDLVVNAGTATLGAAGIAPNAVDHIVIGNVAQAGSDAPYLARHAGLKMGVPVTVPAFIVNRLCGSGFQAWVQAMQMIQAGEASAVLAGGVEQMSMIPYVLRNARFAGYRMGHGEVEDYLTSALTDAYAGTPMAITAENLGELYKISREEVDEYSFLSQQRCAKALAAGVFANELSPVTVEGRKGSVVVDKDEHPRPDVAMEKIRAMKPLFKKEGLVTAATASGIVDGAACTLIMSEKRAKELGAKPLAKILGYASVGCDPKIMGIGPAHSNRKVLEKLGLTLDKMDLIEVNEAFAAQYLAVEKELKLPRERTNINGGAIAIGHPLGASGTRIMNHLVHELQRKQLRYALGSACIGGGQGISVVIERM